MQEVDTWEIDKTEEPEEDEQDLQAFRISYYPADLTLKGYLDKWNAKQLIIPKFQRSYVWDQVKASKLIESFLLGLPVPGVFLYKERNTNKLQVVDGQQRILTSVRFFSNEFDEKIFRLKGVLPKWNGKTYQELPESDRLQLDDTVLRATVIQQLDPDDDSSIFHIFERLNTGGINLNPMEIRKCVYSGVFFDLLDDLNSKPEWRKLIGQTKIDKRSRDTELLLRVLALSREWTTYQKPMKRFLSSFLATANKRFKVENDPVLEAERTKWVETLKFALDQLGEKPFHLRGRLNYAALDSTLIAANLAQDRNVSDFGERYAGLITEEDYLHWVTQDTSDDKVIKSRVGKAISWLSE